jgi:hypothetical protein
VLADGSKRRFGEVYRAMPDSPAKRTVQADLRMLRDLGLVASTGRGVLARWWRVVQGVSANGKAGSYLQAIVDENVLGKPTRTTRQRTAKRLAELYSLDPGCTPFRLLRHWDLAKLYGVTTFNLNKAVKRNRSRFPEDFMFQLSKEEASLTFQIGMSKQSRRGGRRTLPFAFTEQGVAMPAARAPRWQGGTSNSDFIGFRNGR